MRQKKSINNGALVSFRTTPDQCFINAPILHLLEGELLSLFLKHRFQPEIGLEGNALYSKSKSDFQKIAHSLTDEGLSCTLHAPFFDLSPGALDPKIRAATREKLQLAFELIDIFKPQAVICHLNFESNKHGYKLEEWFAQAEETFRQLLAMAASHQTTLALENTYESEPSQHIRMMQALDSPFAKICLDAGHMQAFAKCPWQDWLPAMPWVGHLHLHDNQGDTDTHQAIGHGNFDFPGFLNALTQHNVHPRITLEPHTDQDLWASLDALAHLGVVDLRSNKK
ncbi:MAG: sugar phosphate isomerase/epimerase [Desulfobulbaceae bacterium]|nr:sugar phosphate isomerase/epimerase [Desulfobulbaceae bacterium]